MSTSDPNHSHCYSDPDPVEQSGGKNSLRHYYIVSIIKVFK